MDMVFRLKRNVEHYYFQFVSQSFVSLCSKTLFEFLETPASLLFEQLGFFEAPFALSFLRKGETVEFHFTIKQNVYRCLCKPDEDGTIFGIVRDVTRIKELQIMIEQQAYHDPHTGLLHEQAFVNLLQEATKDSTTEKKVAVLVLDMNTIELPPFLKPFFWRESARRLRHVIRKPADACARLSDDLLAVMITDVSDDVVGEELALRILESFTRPFLIFDIDASKQFGIRPSVGVALHPIPIRESTSLLKSAILSCVKAKQRGKNQYHFYLPNAD